MDRNAKVSSNSTYIFEDEDVDLFDEFSITAILDEAVQAEALGDDDDTLDSLQSLETPDHSDEIDRPEEREPTIDELLAASAPRERPHDETQTDLATADTGTHAAIDVLLDPEILFPKDSDDSD